MAASHFSWIIDSSFVFSVGAFRGFVKSAFTPFFAGALSDGLAAAFLGLSDGMSTSGGGDLRGRDEQREGEMKEAAGGRNERMRDINGKSTLAHMCRCTHFSKSYFKMSKKFEKNQGVHPTFYFRTRSLTKNIIFSG
jgi:hypothetical protein